MDNVNIKKFKLFFSLDKELEFINKMNKEGWKLVYIKGGCLYIFEKTEPDEYFTILHATAKEKVLEISSFAAQCGYQAIPHTMDGFGDILYLTGKKAEVSPEFVCEIYIGMCAYTIMLTAKARRNMKQLQKESEIYE